MSKKKNNFSKRYRNCEIRKLMQMCQRMHFLRFRHRILWFFSLFLLQFASFQAVKFKQLWSNNDFLLYLWWFFYSRNICLLLSKTIFHIDNNRGRFRIRWNFFYQIVVLLWRKYGIFFIMRIFLFSVCIVLNFNSIVWKDVET